ncbi:hypothetical protein [Abyssisolibacter fermentans]|uniref:hypothetical protein n=1 Tax=Abyssisolibacter fermentans TaxID=1766203 RepID=UPI000836CC50|nr:hypothetical protein [Abyssisolibacter fermentans]
MNTKKNVILISSILVITIVICIKGNIFNSKKAVESINDVKNEDVTHLELSACQKKEVVKITKKDEIDKIINAVRNFEKNKDINKEYYRLCNIKLCNNKEDMLRIGVFREDTNTNRILDELNIRSELVITPEDIELMVLENEDDKQAIVEDKYIMQIVINNYHHGFNDSKSIICVHIDLKCKEMVHMYGSLYKNEVSDRLKQLFK